MAWKLFVVFVVILGGLFHVFGLSERDVLNTLFVLVLLVTGEAMMARMSIPASPSYTTVPLAPLDSDPPGEATLSGADLSGADLRGARISPAQLQQARSLRHTILPDGTIHP